MELVKVYDLVMQDFGQDKELALLVVSFHTIHLAEKAKTKDFTKEGKFVDRIVGKFNKFAWQQNKQKCDLAVSIGLALYDFEVKETLQGLGGCVFSKLSDIVKEKQNANK